MHWLVVISTRLDDFPIGSFNTDEAAIHAAKTVSHDTIWKCVEAMREKTHRDEAGIVSVWVWSVPSGISAEGMDAVQTQQIRNLVDEMEELADDEFAS
jgi:hypothetical protein